MRDFFTQDSPFNVVMTKIFDIVLLNFLWLLCSIPIITFGASTTALYTVTLKMVKNEEGPIIKSFFKAFKTNFKCSLPLTLIMLVALGVLTADLHILSDGSKGGSFAYGVCIFMLVVWAVVYTYVFPLAAKFVNTTKNYISNSIKLAFTNLNVTMAMTVLNIAPVALLVFTPEIFSKIFWIWLVVGTGAVAYVNSIFLVRIFDKIIAKDQPENPPAV